MGCILVLCESVLGLTNDIVHYVPDLSFTRVNSQSATASVREFIIAGEVFIGEGSDPIICALIKDGTMKRSAVRPSLQSRVF